MQDASRTGMSRHLHFYYSPMTPVESRCWRSGETALEAGLTKDVQYFGHDGHNLPAQEDRGPHERIVRLGHSADHRARRRLQRIGALPAWWREAGAIAARREDLVIAHSLAALPPAVHIKARTGCALLYDAHELESEREGWPKAVRLAARAVESALIRRCDHTIVVSDSIRDWYERAYPGLKVTTVRNIAAHYPTSAGESALRRDIAAKDTDLVTVYVGAFVHGRGLQVAIEAFKAIDVSRRLVLIGYGPLEPELRARASGLSNVCVLPAKPQASLISYLSDADVGLIVPDGTSLSYRFGLPNKLFEYAAAGLGVVTGEGPEMKRFVAESGLGWTCSPTAAALVQRIGALTRAQVSAKVSSSGYRVPKWNDEAPRLLDAFRSACVRNTTAQGQSISVKRLDGVPS
jgi:glycosyltransferase involved in cell wall biosynthesis